MVSEFAQLASTAPSGTVLTVNEGPVNIKTRRGRVSKRQTKASPHVTGAERARVDANRSLWGHGLGTLCLLGSRIFPMRIVGRLSLNDDHLGES